MLIDTLSIRLKQNRALKRAFGVALMSLRRRRGYSQERLALEAGIDRSHVSGMERGLRSPTLDMLFRLCEILDVPLSALAREIERNYHEQ